MRRINLGNPFHNFAFFEFLREPYKSKSVLQIEQIVRKWTLECLTRR